MIKLGIKMFGFKEMIGKLESFEQGVPKIINKGVERTAAKIKREAIRFAPVDTGRLRGSIGIWYVGENEVFVGSELSYSGFVEFGTMKMRPQPYLRPALEIARLTMAPDVMTDLVHEWEK